MAWIHDFPGVEAAGERAEKAWRMPLGAVSPLWAVFGAAASTGVAFWWLTQWSRAAVNFEALAAVTPSRARPKPAGRIEIVAEPEPAPQPMAEPQPALALEESASAPVEPSADIAPAADDLTQMTGVGPKLSAALAARGVTRFAQIARWTADDLARFDAELSLKGRAVREAWVAQAKRLARGV